MEAALCLGYGPLSSISLRLPSSAITKLHFGFNHSSISISTSPSYYFNRRRQCLHQFYSRGPLALGKSNSSMDSKNENGFDGKVVGRAVGASLALVCALCIFGCSYKTRNLDAIAGPRTQIHRKASVPTSIEAPITPGKMALKSLLDVTVILTSKEEMKDRDVTPAPPSPGSRHLPMLKETDTENMKKEAVSLIKKGHPDAAIYNLKEKLDNADPLTANEINMVLVELLICQGKYDEANRYLERLVQPYPRFDARPILYKAIIYTMLSDQEQEKAANLWKKFAKRVQQFP